jgi:hypothetical protein
MIAKTTNGTTIVSTCKASGIEIEFQFVMKKKSDTAKNSSRTAIKKSINTRLARTSSTPQLGH